MTFFTMLKKQKKLNNLSSAFTLIELLVVIIVIGLLAATLSFNFAPNKLQLAADQLIKNIKLTQSLALKDDKYQPFPNSGSLKDQNQSKYWFKQWWQIKFATDGNDLIYYVFSDKAANTKTNNFDRKIITASHTAELAKYSDGKYVYGGDTYLFSGEVSNQDCNLSKFGIKRIELKMGSLKYSNGYIHLLFDNQGNIFLSEGKKNDKGDINPLDRVRKLATSNIYINLCKKLDGSDKCIITNDKCIGLRISTSGNIEKNDCISIY